MNLDAFLEIESKYGLIKEKINGFAFWEYFRFGLHSELLASQAGYGQAHAGVNRSAWQQFRARLGTIRYALKFHRIPPGEKDILILNHERRKWSGESYDCIYTDLIAAEYPDSVVLERPYYQQHFRPVKTRNLVYTDYIEVKAMFHYYWKRCFSRNEMAQVRMELDEKIRGPIQEICREYGLNYSADSILDKMVCGYYVYQAKRKAFDKIIRKVSPKVILEVVGYHMDCMIVNELALKYGIPTIELQHGAAGREHSAYNFSECKGIEQFPAYFFAFAKIWTEAARFPVSAERIKEVGFPYLEAHARKVMKENKRSEPEIIIFISQGPIGKMLSKIAVQLDNFIDKSKFQILYKLHPGEYEGWKERYNELAASGIEVIDHSQVDLYELFARSTYQVGAFGSTATFEGLYFNLKTYIWRKDASSELCMLCENGFAQFFDGAEDLYQLICSGRDVSKKNMFWKVNALKNMQKEIDAIINEQERKNL